MRKILALGFSVFLWLAIFYPGDPEAADQGTYLGYKGCLPCHEEITSAWEKTRHAGAFESLKKTSQEGLPGCLPCHVTGYEKPGGYVDFEITPELTGVQCEECHGPAKSHAANPGEKGSIIARPDEKKCRVCHTPGQDPNFNYDKKSRLVHSK